MTFWLIALSEVGPRENHVPGELVQACERQLHGYLGAQHTAANV